MHLSKSFFKGGATFWEEIWCKLTQLCLLLVAWLHLWGASLTFFPNTWCVAPRCMTHQDSWCFKHDSWCWMFTDGILTSVGTHTYVTVGSGGLSTLRGSKSWPTFYKNQISCKYEIKCSINHIWAYKRHILPTYIYITVCVVKRLFRCNKGAIFTTVTLYCIYK